MLLTKEGVRLKYSYKQKGRALFWMDWLPIDWPKSTERGLQFMHVK